MHARLKSLAVSLVLALLLTGGALTALGAGQDSSPPALAQVAIRYVSAISGADSGDCTAPGSPCRTIQYAVGQAEAGDDLHIAAYEVTFSGGLPPSIITTTARYTGTGDNVVTLDKSLHLRGGYLYESDTNQWARGLTPSQVDGEGARRPLHISGVTATLELLSFVNGNATRGGNVYAEDATVTFRATPVLSGVAEYGGGLYLKNCHTAFEIGDLGWRDLLNLGLLPVQHNQAEYGGGVYLDEGRPLLSGLYVHNNTATQDGGGFYLASGQPIIAGGLAVDNHAGQRGGGFFLGNSPARIAGMHVYSNTAATGAGFYLDGPFAFSEDTVPIIANTYVRHNVSANQGGGFYFRQAIAGLVNNVIADNQAADGAALYLWAASPQLFHNTLAQNTGASGIHLTHKPGQLLPPVVPIPSRPTFTNTIIVSHTVGVMVDSTGLAAPLQNQATLHGTLWHANGSDAGGAGSVARRDDIFGDPRFTCTGMPPACLNPYHILTDSEALDAGVPVALALPGTDLFVDIDLEQRPSGAGYDIGADEVVSDAYSVWLIPAFSAQSVQPGETATHTHRLLNTGSETDTYTLTHHSSAGWATLLADSPLTLSPQTSATVQLVVNAPVTATADLSDTTIITATSDRARARARANALDVTRVLTGAVADLAVRKQADVERVTPGEAISFTLTVSRTGELTGTLHLTDTIIPTTALTGWTLPSACNGNLDAGRITCDWELPQDDLFSTTFDIVLTTTATYTGLLVNTAWVRSNPPALEPDYGNNADQVTIAVSPEPPPCNPPVDVEITGAPTATLATPATFIAAVTPLTDTAILPMTFPLTYTWEASTLPSQTHVSNTPMDTAVFTWTSAGAQTVTVTVQGPCGDPVSDTHPITVSGGHRIYLPLVLRNAP